MPDVPAYHRQIAAAREVGLAMTRTQLDEFLRILKQYADDLATRVALGFAKRDERYALQVAREIIEEMTRELAASTRTNIMTTARQVAEIHARATFAILEETGAIGTVGTRAGQAVLARPELAQAFRTIRRSSIGAVDGILKRAAVRGAGGGALERELRLHILGSESLPPRLLLDRRRIGYEAIRLLGYEPTRANLLAVRQHAGSVAMKARLIARTEPMNAQMEAHIQSAIDSPVVAFLKWRTSHRHEVPDQCDCLAKVDWYGLGAGIYDPRRCPRRPHPRCICVVTEVLRAVGDFGKPRGALPRRRADLDDVGLAYELMPSQLDSLASVLDDAEQRRAA